MEETKFALFIIAGVIITFALVVLVIIFIVHQNRKYLDQQSQLQKIEAEKQQEVLKAVISTEEKERKRIARDLHDSVGAYLSMIKLDLSQQRQDTEGVPARLGLTIDRLDHAVSSIRAACFQLYPTSLTKYGLFAVIEQSLNNWHETGGIRVSFSNTIEENRLGESPEFRLNLLRIFEEAVNNIVKHGHCSEIAVTINEALPGTCSISIVHDGSPFTDADANAGLNKGIGLSSIRSRLDLLGGNIAYHSTEAKQSVIILAPIDNGKN